MHAPLDLKVAVETAREAVEAAGKVAMRYFRRGVAVMEKPDHTPVTVADKESEAAILEVIRARFPGHDVVAEESGRSERGSATRWLIDPIDGTRGFIRGGSFWGPLVACEHEGRIVAGAMAMPALGQFFWAARGQGSFMNGSAVRVSDVRELPEATLSVGEMRALFSEPLGRGVQDLVREVARVRCYGDLAGVAMLLSGEADIWLEAGVQVWDLGPIPVLIEEAGGRFTDFSGEESLASGAAVVTNGKLHGVVMGVVGVSRA